MTLEQARACVAAAIEPRPTERVPLAAAPGRVLREDVRAREDLPAFDRSAMDGYAIGAEDRAERFRIVGEVRPGTRPTLVVKPGECARVFTGGEIPAGTSQVLKQEDVTVADGWMAPVTRTEALFIRRRGEDARAGACLLRSGTRVGPAEMGLLASLGAVKPLVSARCQVWHVATGDELVDPSEGPGPAQIRDSNSALVRAFAEANGAAVTHQERVPDDGKRLADTVRRATAGDCDLLLLSGGASVGAYDFGRQALTEAGFQVRFGKLNLRPGKPLVFATREQQAAFVLPGNPLSHVTLLHCFVRVALDRMAGTPTPWDILNARLAAGVRLGGDGRDTLWPGRVHWENGEAVVEALRWQSSGDITGLAGLNAFIRCPSPTLDTGARVPCILLHG